MDEPLGFLMLVPLMLLAVFGVDWAGERTGAGRSLEAAVRQGAAEVAVAHGDDPAELAAALAVAKQRGAERVLAASRGRAAAEFPAASSGFGAVEARSVPVPSGSVFSTATVSVGAACWTDGRGRVGCAWGSAPGRPLFVPISEKAPVCGRVFDRDDASNPSRLVAVWNALSIEEMDRVQRWAVVWAAGGRERSGGFYEAQERSVGEWMGADAISAGDDVPGAQWELRLAASAGDEDPGSAWATVSLTAGGGWECS